MLQLKSTTLLSSLKLYSGEVMSGLTKVYRESKYVTTEIYYPTVLS